MDKRQKYIKIDIKKFKIVPLTNFDKYKSDAIRYSDFMGCPGFEDDYFVLHGLIKQFKPITFCEIGTHIGNGTKIICNAMEGRKVLSIDLPIDYDETKEVYVNWNSEKPKSGVGEKCTFPFIQLFGNSKDFDFSKYYPIEAWYIDGRHNYEFCYGDSFNALKSDPKIIIWHDTLMDGVQKAILQIYDENKDKYDLFYAGGTRVSWMIKK